MGLDVNLIKTGINTLSRCATAGAKDGAKVVQLAKNSRLRELGFSEMTHSTDGWSLRGKNISEWFSSSEKEKLQNFIREHTTGTTVTKCEDKTIVQFGNNSSAVNNGLLGFVKRDNGSNINYMTYNTKYGAFNFGIWERNSRKSFLKKLLSGELNTAQKWTIQELDKHLCEDFSEEMIKPVHDYLEGNLNKEKLVELIRKYRKNLSEPVITQNEATLETMNSTIPACFVQKEILDNLNLPKFMRRASLRTIYDLAGNGTKEAQALLKEFLKTLNLSPNKRTPIYRVVGKEEVDKILSGETVRARFQKGAFDVSTRRINGDYRIKFNVEASEKTVDKTVISHYGLEDLEYNYWNVPEYTIKDVKSILDMNNKKVIYESDEEIFSRFIDGYISKLS